MGYTLTFGNFTVVPAPQDRYAHVTASLDKFPEDAPYCSIGNGERANFTWPSYSAWTSFTERYDLYDVFFGEKRDGMWYADDHCYEGLLSRHPGAFEITPGHLLKFEEAYLNAPMTYEEAVIEYEAYLNLSRDEKDEVLAKDLEPVFDTLRLNWLVYWTRWCLENCEYPTFANS